MTTRTTLWFLLLLACGDTTLRPSLGEERPRTNPGPATGTCTTSGAGAGTAAGSGSAAGTGAGTTTCTGAGAGTGAGTAAGPSGSGGGSGASAGGAALPQCADALKRCTAEFTYPAATETSVELRGDFATDGWTRGVALTKSGTSWKASVELPWGQPVQYKFVVDGSRWVLDPINTQTATQGGVTNSAREGLTCPAQYTCAQPVVAPGVFDWRDAVIYSVFVDRFADADPSNDCNVAGVAAGANYAGGDWKGVTQKIESGYFTELGVNTLLLTDVVENFDGVGQGNDGRAYSAYHGYWPTALDRAERCLGTEAELKGLVDAAHAKGLKVLLDYAMVHVHSSSELFQQHPDWFWPLQFNGGECICSDNGPCTWNAQGERCWFTRYLPHWNYTNAQARAHSVGNVIDWVKRAGFDGIRADAIKHVDGSWLGELRAQLNAQVHAAQSPRQRFYMVGETYDFGNPGYLKSFIDPATKLDGQFDFPLRRVLLQTTLRGAEPLTNLRNFMDGNDAFYGPDAVMSTWIGNHDLGRIIHMAERPSRWDQYDNGGNCAFSGPGTVGGRDPYERVAVAFAVLYTNRGAPLLYYGDEIGLPGCGDPDNRRAMPWSAYSADQAWLKARLQKLGAVRAAHPALRRGTRTTISVTADAWLYSMRSAEETLYVAINRGDASATLSGLPAGALTELLEGTTAMGPNATVPPRQARIWEVK